MTHPFLRDTLDRCVLSETEREQFKASSTRREMLDEDEGLVLVCYVREDGHILVDEMIRL